MRNFSSLRLQELEIFENIFWTFLLAELTSGWFKFIISCEIVEIILFQEFSRNIKRRSSRSGTKKTDRRTEIARTIAFFLIKCPKNYSPTFLLIFTINITTCHFISRIFHDCVRTFILIYITIDIHNNTVYLHISVMPAMNVYKSDENSSFSHNSFSRWIT